MLLNQKKSKNLNETYRFLYDFGVLAMMGLVINNYLFRRNKIQQHKKPLERYFEHSNSAKGGGKKRSNFDIHGKTHMKIKIFQRI